VEEGLTAGVTVDGVSGAGGEEGEGCLRNRDKKDFKTDII